MFLTQLVLLYGLPFFCQSQRCTCGAMRNPDVEVKTVLTSSGVSHRQVHLEASVPVLSGLENTCRPM